MVPAVGLGPALFGMSPAEVRRVLGPEAAWPDWIEACAGNLVYAGVRLEFSRTDGSAPLPESRFESVTVFARSDVTLAGRKVGDWTRQAFVDELKRLGVSYRTDQWDLVMLGEYCGEVYFDTDGSFGLADFWDPRWKVLRR